VRLVIIIFACFVLVGCATTQKPEVAVVDTTPQISKTLSSAAPVRSLKRKVAIARFSNETKYGQGIFYDEQSDPIGKQALDILSSQLGATEKFLLLERADLKHINKELQLAGKGPLKLNADYLLTGSVIEYGRKDVSDVGVLSRVKRQVAHAKVTVRLIDVYTGQILYTETGAGESVSEAGTVMGVGTRAAYDSSLNDKAISAAISKLTNNIINNLMDKPWRAYILAAEGPGYLISGGRSQGLQTGDRFAVIKRGRQVTNPQTGMLIELPGLKVAEVVVDQTLGTNPNDEVSLVSVVSGTIDRASGNFNAFFIQEEKGGLR
jgi:curli biogenesis system outer membrane secretion channel CsgG